MAATRSISLPIILSTVAVVLSVGLLVGWTLLIVGSKPVVGNFFASVGMLVFGIVSLSVIMTVLVLFSVFLVQQIREVRRQTSFIDSVTHELKSPLAALKLSVETLGRPDLPAPQHQRLRQMMLDDIDRLTGFIERVLAATRLPAERSSQPLQEIHLSALVRRSAAVVLRRAHLPEAAILLEIPEDLRITTDELALAAVLENLLDNAIKYSPPQATTDAVVVVTAQLAGPQQVVVEVRDKGIGIDRRHLRRVFHRFYRVPDEAVRSRRGTGLGLYVVSALVRSLGGKVVAQSSGLGLGTTMRVTLPVHPRTRALRLRG